MNAQQRKKLSCIINELKDYKAQIEEIQSEEKRKQENMPENLQNSEKADKLEEQIGELEDAANSLDEVIESLETCLN